MRFTLHAAVLFMLIACMQSFGAAPTGAPLGAPTFQPSPDHPVGWRGDGTGRYPGANPPISWERKADGNGYTTKGIVWAARLPNVGVSSPIVVRDRVFLTSEAADVVCLDKKSGKVLWIRSNPAFEGLSAEQRKANPEYAEKLDPLLPQLAKANDEVVEILNAPSPAGAGRGDVPPALKKKREIEKQIHDIQKSIDKELYSYHWGQGVFGFSGCTPVSDGKHVYAFYTNGVTCCYDLDGKRIWINRGAWGGSEHGNFASPLLADGKFVVWMNELRGYDAATGKLLWTAPGKSFNTYGSLFGLQSGKDNVAAFQSGYFVRVSDGKPIWSGAKPEAQFGDSVCTPVVEGGTIYAHVGYPRNNNEKAGFRAFKIPASADEGKLTESHTFDMTWSDTELPMDKKKNPFDRGFVASPLYVDGMIYQVTQAGGLLVHDAATGKQAYRKVLPLKPRTEYWNWAGVGVSPTLAGSYIYIMDNQGTTVVIQPGRQYKEIARNTIEESRDGGKTQEQNLATPAFEGARMYYRTPGFLYCIGQ